MSNTVLFVRIGPKTGPEKFFRCAIQFARTWKRVEVDGATAERLRGEQMLEVTSTRPADYVETPEEAQAAADAQANLEQQLAAARAIVSGTLLVDGQSEAKAGADASTGADDASKVVGGKAVDQAQTPAPSAPAVAKPKAAAAAAKKR